MSKRQDSNNREVIMGGLIILSVVVLILVVLVITQATTPEKALNREGYNTTAEEDPFYKKIETNNTLDDFYNVASNKNSSYEEYYLSKESYNFIEMKMNYNEGAMNTLNIVSNLKTQEVEFNYELSYNSAHLLIEGNSRDTYSCKVIQKKGVNDQTIQDHCNYIMNEITVFLLRREKILQNDKVKELIRSPMKQYVEE